jgi:dephospho-CoA kinase
MSLKIGLTGGVASGKTSVSDRFAKLGIEIIDADVIARDLLKQGTDCYQQVVNVFGEQALLDSADINRSWLREHIFSDPTAKAALESIIHPAVRQALLQGSENARSPYCIVSVPLLIEADMQSLVDRILVVDVLPEQQLERLIQRDNIPAKQAQAMLNAQVSREQRLAFADDIIDNSQTLSELDEQIKKLHQHYLKLAAGHA